MLASWGFPSICLIPQRSSNLKAIIPAWIRGVTLFTALLSTWHRLRYLILHRRDLSFKIRIEIKQFLLSGGGHGVRALKNLVGNVQACRRPAVGRSMLPYSCNGLSNTVKYISSSRSGRWCSLRWMKALERRRGVSNCQVAPSN